MVYIACFLVSTLMAHVASRSKDRGLIILCSVVSILIPCVLGGLRAHGIGTDTKVYGYPDCRAALSASDFFSFLASRRQEIGYSALCYGIMKTLGHQNWCYFAYQLITVSCVYIGLYKHREKISLPFALLIWFFIFYNPTYNNMRQSMAASIILMGFNNIESRRYSKFMLYVFVAFLFHRSSLLALPLIMVMYIVITSEAVRKNLWLKLLIFYGSTGFLFLVRNIFFMIIRSIP
ncbi:MAG: EpsG family protein, partial [Synergistaceae bacterium]|nr:EpsG family protein [Synergistaceae bacterium]